MSNKKEVYKMKKIKLFTAFLALLLTSNVVFAEMFDNLEGLTADQKQRLTNIYQGYKQENNELEMKIMDYTDKINRVKQDPDKSPEQVSLLTSAFERNIETYKSQQKLLEKTLNEQYKNVMTPEQYSQYANQQVNVQDAFSKFLQK